MEVRESQNNLGRAGTYGRGGDEEGSGGRRQVTGAQQAIRKEQRSRYQFDASHSDDEIEDELDDNLGEIGDATKRLKALGLAMGQELDTQNQRIDRIGEKATSLDNRMFRNTERVGSFALAVSFLFFVLIPSCSSSVSSDPAVRCISFARIPDIQGGFSPSWANGGY